MQLLSFFGGPVGIPIGIALVGLWMMYRGYRAHKSGSKKQKPGGGWEVSEKRIPLIKIPQFFIGLGVIIIAIATAIYMHSER